MVRIRIEIGRYWAVVVMIALASVSLSTAFAECVDDPFPDKHCLEAVEFDAALNGPPYPASGVTLLSRIAVNEFPGDALAGADLWGYVSPSGREYALMGLNSAIAFVDITEPEFPVIVEVIPHESAAQSDVKTFGEYAYAVTEGGGGLQVIDMTEIDNGIVTLVNTYVELGLDQAHNLAINEDSGFAYICGSFDGRSDGGLFVLDLNPDPVNPTYAGAWRDAYVHDVQVVTYKQGPNAGREIAFASSGLEGRGSPRLRIIGVSIKTNLWTISTADYPFAAFAHQAWLSEDKQRLFLNDEFDERNAGIPTSTKVFDVSDLENPRYLSEISTGLPSTDHNLMVVGDILFEANYTSGLRILSISEETFGEELGYFDTFPASDEVGFAGAWGVYAKFPSGTVIVSDIASGLFMLDVSQLVPKAVPPPNRGGGGGPCFIATAAYGTPLAEEIDALRTIRDEHLLNGAAGAAFVDFYYRVSPDLADHVRNHPLLAALARHAITVVLLIVHNSYLGFLALAALVSTGCAILYRSVMRRGSC